MIRCALLDTKSPNDPRSHSALLSRPRAAVLASFTDPGFARISMISTRLCDE